MPSYYGLFLFLKKGLFSKQSLRVCFAPKKKRKTQANRASITLSFSLNPLEIGPRGHEIGKRLRPSEEVVNTREAILLAPMVIVALALAR